MKSAQVNLAWRIAHKNKDRYEAYFKASERVWLRQLWMIAIDEERRETLAILLARYSAEARRTTFSPRTSFSERALQDPAGDGSAYIVG